MITGSIFGRNSRYNSTPVQTVVSETQDFDLTNTLINSMLIMEDTYFEITKEHMQATHIAIKDNDMNILEEGLKDFAKSAVNFFANLAKKFKEFTQKAFMHLKALLGNFDKFITKYKDKLHALNPNFTIEGYEYTIDNSTPKLDKIQQVVDSFNSELKDVTKRTKDELVKEREENTNAEYMDKVRAYVIGDNKSISSEDFGSILKSKYRNGSEEPDDIHVDKALLQKYVTEYKDVSKLMVETRKERDRIILLIESLKSFFNSGPYIHYKDNKKVIQSREISVNSKGNGINRGETHSYPDKNSSLELVNIFYNYKWRQAKSFGAIMVPALTEKLNALKEATLFYQKVIRKSIFAKSTDEEGEK